MPKPKQPINRSRRAIMKHGLVAVGVIATGSLLISREVQAGTKASKTEMMYMDKPHGKDQCDGCIHFIAGKTPTADGTCNVVKGNISPRGWCVAFTPKK